MKYNAKMLNTTLQRKLLERWPDGRAPFGAGQDFAAELGVTPNRVRTLMQRIGIVIDPSLPTTTESAVMGLRGQGLSNEAIGVRLGMTADGVAKAMKRAAKKLEECGKYQTGGSG